MAIVPIGNFLFEREEKYKPTNKKITSLKRLEKIDFSGNFYIVKKNSKTNMILIKKGDFVISGINVAKGAMGIYQGDDDITATIHYSSYTFDESIINVEYFKRFLKSQLFINLLKEKVKGGIKTEIKPKHILPLEIDLPPLSEQQKIVDNFLNNENEIEGLASEIIHQQTLLKKLRQQILQDAISGKLTTKWREENPDVEPAEELLARIRVEKKKLVKEGKIKAQKPLPPIRDDEIPFELPKGWCWCRLGDVTNIVRGGSPRPAGDKRFYNGDIPFLKVGDLTGYEELYVKSFNHTIKKTGLHKTRFVEGETLMLTNSGATLGIPRICNFPTTFNDGIAAFIYLSEELDIKYLYFFLKSHSIYFLDEASRGQGQPNLNTDIIGNTLMAFSSKDESSEISRRIQNALEIIDQLEAQSKKSQQEADLLMEAVLHEAFGT